MLEGTEASIVERVEPGGIVYRFSCRVRIDGQTMTLRRFVCSQECFYEPYVVDGLRIWPDMVREVFDLIPVRYPRQGNLQCVPRKSARLAVQDATLRICPQETHPWLQESQNFIDVARCYNGDDCYLGPYLGQACHVGMDINHPKGSLLLAPIDFDTQSYFNSLAAGDDNNRWRGIRRWDNGDVWALQTHHLIDLLVPQNTPLAAGGKYATTAGVHVGSHQHTHFEFKIGRKNAASPLIASDDTASIACPIDFDDESAAAREHPEVLHLDPWIVFWQIFEDRKARQGEMRVAIEPLAPSATGQPVHFAARFSGPSTLPSAVTWRWTFGDGGTATGPNPSHIFAKAGVYPVTLVVDNGVRRATNTQHLVVHGMPINSPMITLDAPDEPSFRKRPLAATDVYNEPVGQLPHTLQFVARQSRPVPETKTVFVRNPGGGQGGPVVADVVGGAEESGWLRVSVDDASGNQPSLGVAVDATGLLAGCHVGRVTVARDGALNSPQTF
ncbi:MAG: PKD domain-containing protein, partial [Planctomycetes bacterium]|nr:PKD domain-containing protein [Planctomycetota bacterium]